MKRFWLSLIFAVFLSTGLFLSGNSKVDAAKSSKSAAKTVSCSSCHADFSSVLPKGHAEVKGSNLAACIECHKPDFTGKAQRNAFSTRIHLAHLGTKANQDCNACHAWVPGKSFGLIGIKGSWGTPTKDDMVLIKQEFTSWTKSGFTDNLHAIKAMDCSVCHAKELPKPDATVENNRCLQCHGPLKSWLKQARPRISLTATPISHTWAILPARYVTRGTRHQALTALNAIEISKW